MSPGPAAAVSSAPAFEATTLLPSYEVSVKKVSAAIADSQTASNAILIGVPNPPSTMTDQDQQSQSKFLLRAIIAQVKQVLETPSGALLAEKIEQAREQTDALLRDTPALLAQYREGIAKVQDKSQKLRVAIEKVLGKDGATAEALIGSFLAKVEGRLTPPDPLQSRQADLRFTQMQLAQAVIGAAADDSNPRLLAAIVSYGKTKFEGHLPTTPREIGNNLGWVQVDGIPPQVSARDRIDVHKNVIADRTTAAIREVTEVVDHFAIHRQKFTSASLSLGTVAGIPLGESRLIGYHPKADLVVQDKEVSRTHLLIERIGQNQWALFDNGSTNGTYVNGEPIKPKTRVEVDSGTTVSIGSTRFVLP